MRSLISGTESKERQLIDGIRIIEKEGWVLVAPDNLTASFNILAESESKDAVDNLVGHYRELVEEAQN